MSHFIHKTFVLLSFDALRNYFHKRRMNPNNEPTAKKKEQKKRAKQDATILTLLFALFPSPRTPDPVPHPLLPKPPKVFSVFS